MLEERPCRFLGDLLGRFTDCADGAEAAVQIGVFCGEKDAGAGASGTDAQRFDQQTRAEHREKGSGTIRHALRDMRGQIGRDRTPENSQQCAALLELKAPQHCRVASQTSDPRPHLTFPNRIPAPVGELDGGLDAEP